MKLNYILLNALVLGPTPLNVDIRVENKHEGLVPQQLDSILLTDGNPILLTTRDPLLLTTQKD